MPPPPATLESKRPVLEFPADEVKIIRWPEPAPWSALRKAMTKEDFESRDWNEGELACTWKFEFNNGYAEAGEERMRLNEIKYMKYLPQAFASSQQGGAEMFPEVEIWLKENLMRKPDFCVLTMQQMVEADQGGFPIPKFMIEVVSAHDTSQYHDQKLIDYFKAGVEVVWHVNPRLEMVVIYTALGEGEIMHGDDICTASPAFPEFQIKAADVFAALKL
ncbi:MAG: Uma2 family endonuclease [Verrucomicrobiaceae bacterium]|nr:Uma2 family endonuclease [Verrucomicrobiaceae bacterium]